jgi:hypothetical protein
MSRSLIAIFLTAIGKQNYYSPKLLIKAQQFQQQHKATVLHGDQQ